MSLRSLRAAHFETDVRSSLTTWAARYQYLTLPVLLGLSSWRDARLLFRYPVAVGLDGYYYVLQVESLHTQGAFHFPTHTPLILLVLTGASHVMRDPVLSIKICSIVMHGFLALGVFAVIKPLIRSFWLALLGCALIQFLSLHLFLISEYLNNLGSVTLLVWASWSAIRAYQTRRAVWLIVLVLLLAAAAFSHKSALGIVSVLTILGILAIVLGSKSLHLWVRYATLLTLVILWLTPKIVAIQKFWVLPPWIERELATDLHWPLRTIGLTEGLLLAIVSPIVLVLVCGPMNKNLSLELRAALGALSFWSLIIALNPFLNCDPGLLTISGRLGYLIYVLIAILVPGVLWLIWSMNKPAVLYVTALVLPLVVLSATSELPVGLRAEYLQRRVRLINALPASLPGLGTNPLIIAPHGDEFVVTATLGIPAQQRMVGRSQGRNVFWLFGHYKSEMLTPSIIVIMSEEGDQSAVVLIEDSKLRGVLYNMSDNERHLLLLANPFFQFANRTAAD